MTENTALWLNAKRADFTVAPAPYSEPLAGEILVRVRAIAINPMDRLIQSVGDLMTPWIEYPFIAGSDVAGEVVAVGADVTRLTIDDRVLGYAAGADKGHRAAEGAFQAYVVLKDYMASPMPDALSFEAGAVLPLALSTAASGLFEQDLLALGRPSAAPRARGETLVIWGGSTSVGSNAIQLAVAAGYDVIATASPRNFDYVTKLGARLAFDYNSKSVVSDIIKALRGRKVAGAFAIGPDSAGHCITILSACEGNRFVAMANPPASFDGVPVGKGHLWHLVPTLARVIFGGIKTAIHARRQGVKTKMIWGSALLNSDVGPMIFDAFLPSALAEGRFVASPQPIVVGQGLGAIPQALDRQLAGVSAAKLVVTL
jgi:NADPH:quinone reductase-like Zn-dependent oxidoreductase